MYGRFSAASTCASRWNLLESGDSLGIMKALVREDLHGDFAAQLRLAGAIHLAMPPAPSGAWISYGPMRVPAASVMVVGPAQLYR